jgi:hypothetical protein
MADLLQAFKEKLGQEGLDFFEAVCAKPFDQQACDFLNAYWAEIGSQADFIFEVAFEQVKLADMEFKGISLIHLYKMGNDLDTNAGLYFYEKLCKKCSEAKKQDWDFDGDHKMSDPGEVMTAIARKKELKEKVDVNYDGRVTFLEYLLYQYRAVCSPEEFVTRSMKAPDEHPEITNARIALENVNERIRAYEAEKARLTELSKLGGVKGLGAKNMLAQIESGPLMEELNRALITAEAKVRIAKKRFGGASGGGEEGAAAAPSQGSIWWMDKDLAVKKSRYGRVKK